MKRRHSSITLTYFLNQNVFQTIIPVYCVQIRVHSMTKKTNGRIEIT